MKNRIVAALAVVSVASMLGGCSALCGIEQKAHDGYSKYVAKHRPDYAVQYEQNFYAKTQKLCKATPI